MNKTKRGRGRPKLTPSEQIERAQRTKISFEARQDQMEMLQLIQKDLMGEGIPVNSNSNLVKYMVGQYITNWKEKKIKG